MSERPDCGHWDGRRCAIGHLGPSPSIALCRKVCEHGPREGPGFVALTIGAAKRAQLVIRWGIASEEDQSARRAHCDACPLAIERGRRRRKVCGPCGCPIRLKTRRAGETCSDPAGPRWTPVKAARWIKPRPCGGCGGR